jgi:hypothetical protein
MNHWTQLSADYANQRSYLDDLFQVYPTIPEGIREMKQVNWERIENAFIKQDNLLLIKELLRFDLFPIKDIYVAFLKRDKSAIERNPRTVNRICGRLYEMGLEKIYERCTEPKETNRQMGGMLRKWLNKKALGIMPMDMEEFGNTQKDAILDGSDQELAAFAKQELNYQRDKGLDLVARFNGQYVIGEAKFLTDFGGHQNAQFNDAIATLETQDVNVLIIAILDGVLYLVSINKVNILRINFVI